MTPELLTVKQVRERIPISASNLYRLAESGEIEHYRIGGRLYFTPEGVSRFLRGHFFGAKKNNFHHSRSSPAPLNEI